MKTYEYQKQTDSTLEAFKWMRCKKEEATHCIIEAPRKKQETRRFSRIPLTQNKKESIL